MVEAETAGDDVLGGCRSQFNESPLPSEHPASSSISRPSSISAREVGGVSHSSAIYPPAILLHLLAELQQLRPPSAKATEGRHRHDALGGLGGDGGRGICRLGRSTAREGKRLIVDYPVFAPSAREERCASRSRPRALAANGPAKSTAHALGPGSSDSPGRAPGHRPSHVGRLAAE